MNANILKTVILLALLTALFMWVGSLFGTYGAIIGLMIALLINFFSYWFSDRIVLAMYRAKPATEKEYSSLFKIVKEVSHLAKIPMPKVYVLPTESANAFATGRNPKHSAIAVTKGIMDLLNDDELRGVIAHEMSHIKNKDTLIMTVAGTIAGVISYIGAMARWSAFFGYGNRENRGIELIVLAILTPIIATILQLAISRSREYFADESAAKILHNPFGLALALEKLDKNSRARPLNFGNSATSSLFIVNPFSLRGFLSLFSTHPPLDERVRRLRRMK